MGKEKSTIRHRIRQIQQQKREKFNPVADEHELSKAIRRVADEIYRDYRGEKATLICVDHGGKPFFNLLYDNLSNRKDITLYFGHVKTTSRVDGKQIDIKVGYEAIPPLHDMHVIIVDDILDSGYTLDFLQKRYSKAKSVETAVLIEKKLKHQYEINPKYIGLKLFERKGVWITGFGMDFKNKYRKIRRLFEVPKGHK